MSKNKLIEKAKQIKKEADCQFTSCSHGLDISEKAFEAVGINFNNFQLKMDDRFSYGYNKETLFEHNTIENNVLFFSCYKNARNNYNSEIIDSASEAKNKLDESFLFLSQEEKEEHIQGYKKVSLAAKFREEKEGLVEKFNARFFNPNGYYGTPHDIQTSHYNLMESLVDYLNCSKSEEGVFINKLKDRQVEVGDKVKKARRLLEKSFSYSE